MTATAEVCGLFADSVTFSVTVIALWFGMFRRGLVALWARPLLLAGAVPQVVAVVVCALAGDVPFFGRVLPAVMWGGWYVIVLVMDVFDARKEEQ